jgi:hypothetical protein
MINPIFHFSPKLSDVVNCPSQVSNVYCASTGDNGADIIPVRAGILRCKEMSCYYGELRYELLCVDWDRRKREFQMAEKDCENRARPCTTRLQSTSRCPKWILIIHPSRSVLSYIIRLSDVTYIRDSETFFASDPP